MSLFASTLSKQQIFTKSASDAVEKAFGCWTDFFKFSLILRCWFYAAWRDATVQLWTMQIEDFPSISPRFPLEISFNGLVLLLLVSWVYPKLYFQAFSWSYLSPKVNVVVVRLLDQILRAKTRANGDFAKIILKL